jgi:hypothetical protein
LRALQAALGDVLWYLARVATELGLSLDVIAEHNIARLLDRKSPGAIHGDQRITPFLHKVNTLLLDN